MGTRRPRRVTMHSAARAPQLHLGATVSRRLHSQRSALAQLTFTPRRSAHSALACEIVSASASGVIACFGSSPMPWLGLTCDSMHKPSAPYATAARAHAATYDALPTECDGSITTGAQVFSF